MKYTKPQAAIDEWNQNCYFTDAQKMSDFLDSLPDEFEIVEPGMTQVRWPEDLTKGRLEELAIKASCYATEAALDALAAIAPEEKKKRKVNLYERHDKLLGWVRVWDHLEFHELQPGWRKVGECEVTE